MTKLALINVINDTREIEKSLPPLGLAYIAAYLRKYADLNNIMIIDNASIDEMERYKPDIIGISSVSQNFDIATKTAKTIKSMFDIPVIIGGVHITALPHTLPNCFDIGVLREGEQTMLELIDAYDRQGLEHSTLKKIKGIVFRESDKIEITNSRPLIQPLDKIPFPARDLLRISEPAHIITSRGCPFKCVFCSSSSFWQKTRFFTPQYVVNEIKEIIDTYHIKVIHIWDDLFIANKKRLKEISELIRREGINDIVTFSCQCRPNLMDHETCKILKSMDVSGINFGIESGSDKILKYLKNNTVTVEQNKSAIDIGKKYGFTVGGSFMIGSPGETKEDMEMSLKFLKESKIDFGCVYVTTPFPDTEIWNYAKEKGFVDDFMEWIKLDVEQNEIIRDFKNNQINTNKKYILLSDKITPPELCEIYMGFEKEFERPKQIAQLQEEINKISQLKSIRLHRKIEGVLRKMRIRRKEGGERLQRQK